MDNYINIKNARIHNLKGIDIKIPKNKLTVITGVSGSGKSSLAFDTLFEEGKRRYLMFSGTQFMVDSMQEFDSITGLSPTVAVEQRIIRQSNPRSTVSTRTKIGGMLAVLYATYGTNNSMQDVPLSMEMFQKNSAKGMCVKCLGTGTIKKVDDDKLFNDLSQHVEDVCFGLGRRGSTKKLLDEFCKYHKISPNQTLDSLSAEVLLNLRYGDNGKTSFDGFVPLIMKITTGAFSSSGRLEYLLTKDGLMNKMVCPKCGGTGLGGQAVNTRYKGKNITELESMYIKDLHEFLSSTNKENNTLVRDIITKLECMIDVGLHHISLSRPIPTLSGGEIQRLFLASYIIAQMDSIIFIFDEPTIGLHEAEKAKLISIIKNLVNRGNTVIAVEHDENFMREADYIVDLGPNAGIYGGERIFQGSFEEFLQCKQSNTSPYLSNDLSHLVKDTNRPIDINKMLKINNATLHNLKGVSVDIPLGVLVGIAGVSGSGKSSLITDTLVKKLNDIFNPVFIDEEDEEFIYDEEVEKTSISGVEHIKKCIIIDQKPIGRSKTSCPATYTKIYDRIRALFANESDSSIGLFSLNSSGACKGCKGYGEIHYHVGYGNVINILCETCNGTGFVKEAMEVVLDGKNIKDVLNMSVDEAKEFFSDKDNIICNILETLQRVGLGYITLGQKTPTISGGESQRIKLAKELSKTHKMGNILYILDEPTTGLSIHDSVKLNALIQELVDSNNSVIVTEHDPFILSNCDYIIEMGIGGGSDGGNIIAVGTKNEVKKNKNSIIGKYLK